jgi:N-acyl-L-homoserine lactone synthetase
MIHIVTGANRALYAQQLRDMHALRWKYYIEARGWTALRELQDEPGFETDEYDDADAVYLLSLNADGRIGGSIRLRRTDRPTLLLDHFRDLIAEPESLGLGPDVWEITRVIRTPENRAKTGPVKTSLNVAMIEFALTRGAKRLIGVCDTFMLPGIIALWKRGFRPIGLPAPYAEGEMIAVSFEVSEAVLSHLRAQGEQTSVEMFEPPPPPSLERCPLLQERLARSLHALSEKDAEQLAEWLEGRARADLPMAS